MRHLSNLFNAAIQPDVLFGLQWGTCRLNGTVPEMNEQLGPEGVVSTCRLLVDVVAFYLVISGLYIPNL